MTRRPKKNPGNDFNNNMSTDSKFYKAQISKIIQSGVFIGSLLIKLACPLMKVANPLAKDVLAPLGETAATSEIDGGIQKKKKKKKNTALEQALKGSNIFLKRVTEAIKNENKRTKRRFFKYVIRYFRYWCFFKK